MVAHCFNPSHGMMLYRWKNALKGQDQLRTTDHEDIIKVIEIMELTLRPAAVW